MLRHAVWLLNRFQLHDSDNKTSFQRRWGTAYRNSVLPFGELVLSEVVKRGGENGVARSPCFSDTISEKGCVQR